MVLYCSVSHIAAHPLACLSSVAYPESINPVLTHLSAMHFEHLSITALFLIPTVSCKPLLQNDLNEHTVDVAVLPRKIPISNATSVPVNGTSRGTLGSTPVLTGSDIGTTRPVQLSETNHQTVPRSLTSPQTVASSSGGSLRTGAPIPPVSHTNPLHTSPHNIYNTGFTGPESPGVSAGSSPSLGDLLTDPAASSAGPVTSNNASASDTPETPSGESLSSTSLPVAGSEPAQTTPGPTGSGTTGITGPADSPSTTTAAILIPSALGSSVQSEATATIFPLIQKWINDPKEDPEPVVDQINNMVDGIKNSLAGGGGGTDHDTTKGCKHSLFSLLSCIIKSAIDITDSISKAGTEIESEAEEAVEAVKDNLSDLQDLTEDLPEEEKKEDSQSEDSTSSCSTTTTTDLYVTCSISSTVSAQTTTTTTICRTATSTVSACTVTGTETTTTVTPSATPETTMYVVYPKDGFNGNQTNAARTALQVLVQDSSRIYESACKGCGVNFWRLPLTDDQVPEVEKNDNVGLDLQHSSRYLILLVVGLN